LIKGLHSTKKVGFRPTFFVFFDVYPMASDHLADGPCPDAAGADFHGTDGPLVQRLHFLKVGVPDLPSFVMGMTDVVASRGFFPADFADSGHIDDLLDVWNADF
jgi:hypothetical protein